MNQRDDLDQLLSAWRPLVVVGEQIDRAAPCQGVDQGRPLTLAEAATRFQIVAQ